MSCSKLSLGTSYFQKVNNTLYLTNQDSGGTISIQVYDSTGILRQLTYDSNMNCSGINDLYVQRIFFNNNLFNPSDVTTIKTNGFYVKALKI